MSEYCFHELNKRIRLSSCVLVPEENQDSAAGAGSGGVGRPGPRCSKREGVQSADVWTAGTLP